MSQIAQVESPLREFQYFPLLPKELRDMVWEFASQSQLSTPSMHFFQLETVLEEHPIEGRDDIERCILTVPQCTGFVQDKLGFRFNSSSYLNDLAVWDACCEARHLLEAGRARAASRGNQSDGGRIMTVRNKVPDDFLPWKKGLSGWQTPGETCPCSYGSHYGSAAVAEHNDCNSSNIGTDNDRGAHRNLLINLEQDVLCLTFDWDNLKAFMRDGSELLEIPELRGLKNGYPVRKIALQYHPDWIGGRDGIQTQQVRRQVDWPKRKNSMWLTYYFQEDGLRDVLDVLSQYQDFPLLECLYLIDYRITPRDQETRALDSTSTKEERQRPAKSKVFEARGMSFHEVEKDDQDWCLPDDQPFTLLAAMAETNAAGRWAATGRGDVPWAAEGLHEAAMEGHEEEEESQGLRDLRDWAGKWGLNWEQKCQFKVLACLPA